MKNAALRVHDQKGHFRAPYRYEGARDGIAVVGWLRLNGSTPNGIEVTKLLGDLQRLMSLWPDFSLEPDRAAIDELHDRNLKSHGSIYDLALDVFRTSPRIPWSSGQVAEVNELIRAIQDRLARLFYPPKFYGFAFENGRKRMCFRRFPRVPFLRAALIAEPLFNLGKLGLLHRIRQCPRCGLWIFAKCERETCCSDACRQDLYRTTKDGRRKRVESQKRYRKKLKDKKEAEDRRREEKALRDRVIRWRV